MAFHAGQTISLPIAITDINSEAADPASVKINIAQPDDKLIVDSKPVSKIETGSYNYDYLLPEGIVGTYRYNVVAVGGGGRITIAKSSFLVLRPLL